MSIGENIRRLRIAAGLTQKEIAGKVGVCTSTVTQWELGMSAPRMSRVDTIAKALGVSSGEIVEDWRNEGLADLPSAVTVPLATIESGEAEPMLGSRVEVPVSVLKWHPDAWAMPVVNDAMDRVLPCGFMVVCDPGLKPANGNIVVVSIDGGGPIMRRWYKGGNTVMLVAESNEPYDDIVLAGGDSFRVLSTVVWVQPAELLA